MDVKLMWFKSTGEQKEYPLLNDLTTIGRREDCDLRIALSQISRRHCQISKTPQGVFIRDLGSANGTFVNNQRVQEAQLNAGDQLIIGPVTLVVRIDGQPGHVTPPPPASRRVPADRPSKKARSTKAPAEAAADPISALEALAGEAEQKPEDPFEKRKT